MLNLICNSPFFLGKDIDLEQSLAYAQKALKLARKIDDKEKEVEGLLNLGIRLYETADRDSALAYFEEGILQKFIYYSRI